MPSKDLSKVEVLKLLLKISILSITGILTFYLIDFFNPYKVTRREIDYPAAIIDKQSRAESIHSPKVILVGGSNLAMGVDSKMLSDSLKLPVVNLAMQYNLGSYFLLNQAKFNAKSNDIIIICFEYIMESEGNKYEQMAISNYFDEANNWIYHKHMLEKYFDQINYKIGQARKIGNYITAFNDTKSSNNNDIFYRKAFNSWGDITSHLNKKSLSKIPISIIPSNINTLSVIRDLNQLNIKMNTQNTKVYYSFPPMCESSFVKNEENINKLSKELRDNSKIILINTPKSMKLPDSLFYDMAYHLNVNGRPIRTAKLIKDVKLALKKDYK